MTGISVLITGATGDIGMALARAYAKPGNTLALIGKDNGNLAQIIDDCRQLGAEVTHADIDVRDYDLLSSWIMDIDRRHPIDVAIANAGVTSSIGKDGTPEQWQDIKRVFDVNMYGTLHTIQPLIEPMRQRGQGQIGIVSSLAAYRGLPVTPAYSGSKAAVKVYGEAIRGVLADDGVGVSVICPGFVQSAMSDKFMRPKPFMITPIKAAAIIKRGLDANKARISFPFPLNLGTWFLALTPPLVAEILTDLFKYGKR
jgi:short-subunit dehydrogenase